MSWLFSQALVEASLRATGLDGLASAQLSVMPTAQPFWRKDKPMDASRFFQFGLTSELLTETHGEALCGWFRGDFLAKTSPSLAEAPESMVNALGSGRTSLASLGKWDPNSSTWKTPQRSLVEGLDEFSETWPRSGLMLDGECWELTTLELRTSERESGYLPTPCTIDSGSLFNRSDSEGAALRPTLGAMARFDMWPTPCVPNGGRSVAHAEKVGNSYYHNGKKVQFDLNQAVKQWPTPAATDYKGSVTGDSLERRRDMARGVRLPEQIMRMFPTLTTTRPHDSENTAGKYMPSQNQKDLASEIAPTGGQLNPMWVEWLMGWPLGWTDLKPLEMAKFREWQSAHGNCLPDNQEGHHD